MNVPDTPIRTVIVEDNCDSLKRLKSMLPEFPFIHLMGEAQTGRTAVELIDSLLPDLVFMDIQLPDMDGFEILKTIGHEPAVIFTTAFDQYALKAFDANSIDYILKPIKFERLAQALDKIQALKPKPLGRINEVINQIINEKNKKVRFSIPQNDEILIIPQEDVYYFKSEDRYLFLCTYNNSYFYNSSLKKLEQALDPALFIRIDKSYIVSLDKIKRLKRDYLKGYKVILKDKKSTSLKVSRNCLPKLKEQLDNL
ncbi:MAG: response regulator transcription factor [bacterium]|nr:response regulator transcription factor [bacterium]